MTKQQAYHQRKPWVKFVSWARRRCTDPGHRLFKSYGAKGVECRITAADLERAWKESGADKLKRPSLDRFPNTAGHYEAGNIRFIEYDENRRLAAEERRARGKADEDAVPKEQFT